MGTTSPVEFFRFTWWRDTWNPRKTKAKSKTFTRYRDALHFEQWLRDIPGLAWLRFETRTGYMSEWREVVR